MVKKNQESFVKMAYRPIVLVNTTILRKFMIFYTPSEKKIAQQLSKHTYILRCKFQNLFTEPINQHQYWHHQHGN